MKIDNSGKVAAAYGAPVRAAKKEEVATQASGAASRSESVAISSQGLAKAAQASEAFDADKVAAIKAAIAAGEFKINPEAIADSLIASTRELLAG